jgi:S1-C subfamily serine protease
MKNLLLPFSLLGLLLVTPAAAQDPVNGSVVKIHVTNREPDFARPWAKGSPKQIFGSGVIIEGKRILTNAHVVNYAIRILVQGHQSTERIPARVLAISPEMDLALLGIDNDDFFNQRRALQLDSQLPKAKDTISAYGYPIGGEQLSVTEGIVSRVEFSRYNFGSMGMRIQVDAGLNPGNSGGPAIREGKIAGIVYSVIRSAENIGYVIPAEEVRLFLADIADETYDGKPNLVGFFQTVENPTLRQRLGLEATVGGLMVRDPIEDAEDYPLKAWDVITHVGGHALDKKGNVRLEDGLNISFRYLMTDLVKENLLPVTILREGETQDLQVPVVTEVPVLVPHLKGAYPRHFIFGPLVFTTASQDLIARINAQIQLILKARKNPVILRQFDRPAFPGEELVILSVRMFPHPLVEGYDQQSFAAVHRVNGVDIKNLLNLVETIRDSEGDFLTIEFHGLYETMVLPRQEMFDSTEQILEDEGIRTPYSDDLRETWENRKK